MRDTTAWFDNGTAGVDELTIDELAAALRPGQEALGLPSFQRDAAWNEQRLELLWDSLLRQYPIGSLLLVRTADYADLATRNLTADFVAQPPGLSTARPRWLLLDGQQRCTAIKLGMSDDATKENELTTVLWFDLAGAAAADPSPFHACTRLSPWGRRATDAQQRDALQRVEGDWAGVGPVPLLATWPTAAAAPVQWTRLVAAARDGKHGSLESLGLPRNHGTSSGVRGRAEEAIPATLTRIRRALGARVPVVLLRVPDPHAGPADDGSGVSERLRDLRTAFDRLNTAGVPMTGPDLFYSALKLALPSAHELVWGIRADEKAGKLLEPNEIVHLAVRLVAAARGREGVATPDFVRLDLEAFERLMARRGPDRTDLAGALERFIDKDGDRPPRMRTILARARSLVEYRGGSDPGFPAPFLRGLDWRVWAPIAAWLDCTRREQEETREASRLEILRFVVVMRFFRNSTKSDLARISFDLAHGSKGGFPGEAIFRTFQREGWLTPAQVPSPADFSLSARDQDARPVGELLRNEDALLLWAQRLWLTRWFPAFDPTQFARAADLPYDVDHIVPSDHLKHVRAHGGVPDPIWERLGNVVNSIGNKRLWPRGANRSDQHAAASVKLHVTLPPDTPTEEDGGVHRLGLVTAGDVRAASFVSESEASLWLEASTASRNKDWSQAVRFEAFRRAVESRRSRLWTEMHGVLGLAQWEGPPTDERVDEARPTQ